MSFHLSVGVPCVREVEERLFRCDNAESTLESLHIKECNRLPDLKVWGQDAIAIPADAQGNHGTGD